MMRTHRSMLPLLTLVACATRMACSSFAALQTNVVERHYDRFGRPVGVSLNGERRTEIAYDEATGRIASMRVAGADEPFRWDYESGSDLKKTLHYPNGAAVEWEYEPNRDLVTLVSNDVYSSYRYEYDAAGRRIAKNDEMFVYDGYLNISQTDWDPTEPVATRPLVWRGVEDNAFCFHDGNKNVVDLVPVSSASTIWHYGYAPFGEVLGERVGNAAPWLLSSEFDDCDLGLAYYNYRHYSFMDGRWMRRDPVDGINPYLWCKNNPSGVDYLGLTNEPGVFGWENYSSERFACCNGVKYLPSVSCCSDGVVYSRRAIPVGVSYYCKHARYWYPGRPGSPRQFMLTHCWLNVDGMRFGAYPNGGFLKKKQKNGMSIQDDSGHAEDEGAWNTFRTDIELSPCHHDIDAFKTCLRKLKDSSNWKWRIWNNCGDFVDAAVTECMRSAERK